MAMTAVKAISVFRLWFFNDTVADLINTQPSIRCSEIGLQGGAVVPGERASQCQPKCVQCQCFTKKEKLLVMAQI